MNKQEQGSSGNSETIAEKTMLTQNEAEKEAFHSAAVSREMNTFLELYRLLAERSRDIMLFFRTDGEIIEVNNAACEIYGYTREEILGKSFYEIRAERTRAEIPEQMRRAAEGAFQFETVHCRKDGSEFPVEASWSLIEINGEQIILSVVRDITERKREEETLRVSEERLHLAMQGASISPFDWNIKTGEIQWTSVTEESAAMSAADFNNSFEGFIQFVHPQDRETLRRRIETAFKDGEYECEFRMLKSDGSIRWLIGKGRVFFDDEGNPARLVGVDIDITKRKQAEEALMENQRFTESIIETAPSVLYLYDIKTNRNTYLTTQAVNVLGYSFDEMKSADSDFLKTFMHPDDTMRAQKYFEKIKQARNGETFEFEYRMRHKSGEWRWFKSRDKVFRRDAQGKAQEILGVAQDITERKIAEQQLRASEAILQLGVEVADFAICQIDYATNTNHLSKEAARLYDLGDEAMTVPREKVHATFHPDDREELARLIEQALNPAGGGWFALEHRIIRRNGEIRWLNVRKQIYFDTAQDPPRPTIGILAAQDITTRKKAEEELRASEEFNRTVLENSPDCVKILDAEGHLQFMNVNGLCLMEIDNFDALKNEFWWNLWTGEAQTVVKDSVQKALQGETAKFQAFCPTAKGTPKWWDVIVAPIPSEDAKSVRLLSVSRDITESKQAEEARQQFVSIIEQTNDFVGMGNFEGKAMYVNPAGLQIVGLDSLEAVRGTKISDFHPDDVSRMFAEVVIPQVLEKGFWEGETQLRHFKTKEPIDVYQKVFVIRHPKTNAPICLATTALDITERKQAEKALRESEERYSLAEAATNDGLWDWDPQTGYDYLSTQWKALLGFADDELPNHQDTFFSRIHPDDVAATQEAVRLHLEENQPYAVEFRLRHKDGSYRYFLSRGQAIRNESGAVVRMVGSITDITKRKEAEEISRATQDTFRQLVENSPFGIYVVDADFRLALVGKGAQKVFENVRPLIGRDFAEVLRVVWQEPFATEAINFFRHTLETGETYHSPSTVERRGDIEETEAYDWKIERITMPDGRLGVVCHFYDLSERQRYEAILRESEDRFRTMANTTPSIIWTAAPDGRITFHNQQWLDYTGLTPEENKGNWAEIVLHPDDYERCTKAWAAALAAGEKYEIEVRNRRCDGEYRWFLTRAVPVRNEAGEIVSWFGSTTDIHDKKIAEEQLRESEKFVRSTLNSLAPAVAILNHEGVILDVNNAWKRFAIKNECRAPSFGIGLNYLDVVRQAVAAGDTDAKAILKGLEAVLNGQKKRFEYEYPCHSPDEQRWFILNASPLNTGQGGAVVSHINITERRLAEEALKEAARRKDEFLATLAHELRNPLAPVRSGLEIIRRSLDDKATVEQTLETVERQAEQIQRLVDDLLDISRITHGKIKLQKSRITLREAIKLALETSAGFIEKLGCALTVSIPDEPIYLDADLTRVAQIILNLLNNAAKYNKPRGLIWLRANCEGDEAVISILDTGMGIPSMQLTNIFEPYNQIETGEENRRGGIGIGLSVAKTLVEMHGGSITAQSEGIDKGSEFTVRLPLAAEQEPEKMPTETQSEELKESASEPRRVLIVDDNEDAARMLEVLLRMENHEARTALSGRQALETADDFKPEIALLDIGLPDMDGYEVARQLRKKFPAMRLIAISGWGLEEDRRQSKEAGFDFHLVKPVEFDELKKLINF